VVLDSPTGRLLSRACAGHNLRGLARSVVVTPETSIVPDEDGWKADHDFVVGWYDADAGGWGGGTRPSLMSSRTIRFTPLLLSASRSAHFLHDVDLHLLDFG
jgi:hypothetical protein